MSGARSRRLLVLGPPGDGRVADQLARLQTDSQEALSRDVQLEEAGAEGFAVVLVGRDGTEKRRWPDPVAPADVWAVIDAMPMRQAETAAQEPGADDRTTS